MNSSQKGGIQYQNVDEQYLKDRQLQKRAGWILLWAMGVGAVISGDFFGWNLGLAVGGFGGLAIATLLMAVMYICMVFSIAELSAAMPHAGGFYSFVRNAMGPTAGYLCGVTDAIEYVITPAVIVVAVGGYMNSLVYGSSELAPSWAPYVWWGISYGFFVFINIRGVELTLKVGLVITGLAIAVLLVFYGCVFYSGAFNTDLLFNIEPQGDGSSKTLPFGLYGIFAALPFAMWFYLAIEQLPLAAEEAHDVPRDMPRALLLSMATLLVLSLLTLVLNTGVGGGAAQLGASEAPLWDGFQALFGSGATTRILSLIALTGLIASFHSIIYAYGRVLFSLSRAGYFPRWISVVNRQHTPQAALILGAVVGFGCAIVMHVYEKSTVGAALLNMAVFGAVISYTLVMISFIVLRVQRPEMPRPYRSPLGIGGAVVGTVLSLIALCACFAVSDYRPGVAGAAVFVVIGMAYYFLYSRKRLVAQAPEEEIALIAEGEKELQ